MDNISFEEIVRILSMVGRPDLLQEFRENVKVDHDYKPPKNTRKERLGDSEGSAISEDEYQVDIDDDGFQSLA